MLCALRGQPWGVRILCYGPPHIPLNLHRMHRMAPFEALFAQCCENGCQVPNLALGKLAWHLAKNFWHLATFSLLRKSVWHLANLFKVPQNHTILNQNFKNFLGEIPQTPFHLYDYPGQRCFSYEIPNVSHYAIPSRLQHTMTNPEGKICHDHFHWPFCNLPNRPIATDNKAQNYKKNLPFQRTTKKKIYLSIYNGTLWRHWGEGPYLLGHVQDPSH